MEDEVLRQLERCERLLLQVRALVLEKRGLTTSGGPTAAGIKRAVAAAFGISEQALVGAAKYSNLVLARLTAAYLMRRLCSMSWPQIGNALSRDHSTLMKLMRGWDSRCQRDPQLERRVRYLMVHFGISSPSPLAAATLERELLGAGYRPQTARAAARIV